jgi:CheY-like chemotaxis protein
MQAWQMRLNERKQQFLTKTKNKVSEVLPLLDDLQCAPNDLAKLTAVNKFFHQLAGAGGIYEMEEFCKIAIAAEELCSKRIADTAPVTNDDLADLRRFCDGLIAEIELEQARPPATTGDTAVETITPASRQFKILSVEDDLEQAHFIKSTLESAGYKVLHIADPSEFEQSLISFAPDLVLLDIMLGDDISGHDLARAVRRNDTFNKLPIVFLTTQNQVKMHLESARAGGDEHLIKPISPQLLISAIAGRLQQA